jgi:acyl-homoserine-lactone acylase
MKQVPVLLFLLISPLLTGSSVEARSQGTEILWDKWGVPHIFAKDADGLFYAFGWAQMQSHGDLILRLYGRARGRAAEYWGQEYIESDRWVRTMGVPERARRWYEAQPPYFRRYLDAFADGINKYARQHSERLSDDLKVVLPVSAIDVIAHAQHVINFTFVANPRNIAAVARDWNEAGSNAWAIAPGKSENGHAMLLANPHLPWFSLYLFYEAQLHAPGINVYGATLVGFPVMGIAFNDHLGWTHTVNTYDGADHYELTLKDGGYRWNSGIRRFTTTEQTIRVKQSDGTYRDEKLLIKASVHGPLVMEKNGKAIVQRVAGLDRPGLLHQWWKMGQARNLREFELAMKQLQIPMFNVIYADRNGHIMYLFNGMVPIRSKGDSEYWEDTVPGDTAETLWTRIHPYNDLPRIIDPPSHWLQNANDPPWTTTFPPALNPNRFPAYMSPRFMSFRAQRSARMILEDDQISFEEMIRYKYSTRVELADRILNDLIQSARREGSETAMRAADVLERWDRQTEANSRGAALFILWTREMGLLDGDADNVFAIPWNEKSPLTTPAGLASPDKAAATLISVATKLQKQFGSFDVAWGELARLQYGKADFPGNGGSDRLGIFRVIEYSPESDGHLRSVSGDSYVAAIEFSKPVRARVLLGYGNSSQPNSPHRGDQLELSAKKELRPAWRTRAEIEANLESREVLKH